VVQYLKSSASTNIVMFVQVRGFVRNRNIVGPTLTLCKDDDKDVFESSSSVSDNLHLQNSRDYFALRHSE
jgi:hypothetical protein